MMWEPLGVSSYCPPVLVASPNPNSDREGGQVDTSSQNRVVGLETDLLEGRS